MNIYVGNVSRDTNEDELRHAFEAFGNVDSVTILKDKFTNESRGFGFIEMPVQSEAEHAIESMNGKELGGRTLTVNEARPRTEERTGGGGGGRGPRRSGGGGGGNRW